MGKNIMYFDTDDEFTDFCLNSNPTIIATDTGTFYDYDFTPMYNDAIANGVQFMINDDKSKVKKRGCVCRGLITKRVENLN